MGISPSAKPRVWAEQEYYFDSKKQGFHKTELELVEDCIQFCMDEAKTATNVYVDPSAVSFITCLNKYGRQFGIRAIPANNEVLPGITKVASYLNLGRLKIAARCDNLISEMYSYSWDKNKADRGVDEPKKEFDHAIDALRYFMNMYGDRPIREPRKIENYSKQQLEWPFADLI